MRLRQTQLSDVGRVMEIINQAKSYFKANGIDQWQDGYPNEQTIIDDININEAYVLVDDNDYIVATCMVTIRPESTYVNIDGQWLFDTPYVCVHRIAVDNNYKGKGLASQVLDAAVALYPGYKSVRMDTHDDNLSMQRFLLKYGFKYCGYITLLSGALRRAYEKEL